MKKVLRNKKGVALIVVLWVTVLLTVMVNAFIVMVRTEARDVSIFKSQTEAYFLARSGINLAIAKLQADEYPPVFSEEEGADRWYWDGRSRSVPLWEGSVEIRVMDEGGKIDINKAGRSDLVRVLLALGIEGSERDTIIDSILDWRDKNNFHRLNGAEDDYYRSLPDPYESRDALFDTTDELLWVKGVTPEFFFGEAERVPLQSKGEGMVNVFTVYTDSVRVNVNTAPFVVLLSLPGMDEETALSIVDAREGKVLQSMGDFTRAGGKLAPTISKYVTFSSPRVYTIEAVGRLDKRLERHAVRAVVKIDKKKQVQILYWKDQGDYRRSGQGAG